ncbi:MAG: DNA polymerase III subunit beta [Sulfobacillus benefaciens]|uniref:Beta sliding clamp n=1 Tax=Sulfobacillus benefaciens TaxID=453960 RepID=A0A2T2XCP2_9FIRM|nr:MAG: DNA polymerase III subunit beta [Sulfobacillus benefaciens]
MRLSTDQFQLSKALDAVSRLVAAQNTLPILGGIQLTATPQGLTVTATDLFSRMTVTLPAYVTEPGAVVLPASTLHDLVHRIPTATMDLQSDNATGKTIIRYGPSRTTIHGFGTEQLPAFPDLPPETAVVTLDPSVLTQIVQQTVFACAKSSDSRPILQGVQMALDPGQVTFVATDGSRLSVVRRPLPQYTGAPVRTVIPEKVMKEGAQLGSGKHPVTLTLAPGFLVWTSEDTVLQSRVLEGEFPDYARVVPQEYPVQIHFSVSDFKGGVERAQLIASRERSNALTLRHQAGSLRIEATAADLGQALEELECVSEGPEMTILFNATFMLEALKALKSDEGVMEWSGVQSAARIRDAADPTYFHVMLPLRQLV